MPEKKPGTLRLAHIINPAKVKKSSDLYRAQPITFKTMKVAKEFATHYAPKGTSLDVTLYSAQFPWEGFRVPSNIKKTPRLSRSILDQGQFKVKRKLPLLKDILDRLYQVSDADYFIFTNVDIGLLPHFYLTAAKIIESGTEAFVINRRTIGAYTGSTTQIPRMYAEIGQPHCGHDCFISKREIYPQFKLGSVCVGIRLVGRVLLWNLVRFAPTFKELKDYHLTFHIGEGKEWKNPAYLDYDYHNHWQALEILEDLSDTYDFVNFLQENQPEYLSGINLTLKESGRRDLSHWEAVRGIL